MAYFIDASYNRLRCLYLFNFKGECMNYPTKPPHGEGLTHFKLPLAELKLPPEEENYRLLLESLNVRKTANSVEIADFWLKKLDALGIQNSATLNDRILREISNWLNFSEQMILIFLKKLNNATF